MKLFLTVSYSSLLFPTFPYCFPRFLTVPIVPYLLSSYCSYFPYCPYCSVLSLTFPTVPHYRLLFLLFPIASYYLPMFPTIPHCFLLSPIVSYYPHCFLLSPLFPTIPIVSYCPSTASYCPLQFFFFCSSLIPCFVYVIQTIPFWPNKTPAKNLKIKTDESSIESVPFNFESNVNLLLRMDNGVREKK